MAWIKTLGPGETDSKELEKLYQRVSGPEGSVDHVLQIHSLRPHTLAGHMALYKAVLHHRGNKLSEWFLEALGVWVSRLNGCEYCDRHHTEGMRRHLRIAGQDSEPIEKALDQAKPGQPFDEQQQAALTYAHQLTRHPESITEGDIEQLRATGMDDGEILEINQVVAYFNYANRIVSGLGVELEKTGIGQSPDNSGDPDDWSHV